MRSKVALFILWHAILQGCSPAPLHSLFAQTPFQCISNRTGSTRIPRSDPGPAICAGGADSAGQQVWLRGVEAAGAAKELREGLEHYYYTVYCPQAHAKKMTTIRVLASELNYFWNFVPGRSTFTMSWGCIGCLRIGAWPEGLLFAPQEEAQFNPELCQGAYPCNKKFLLERFSAERLRFQGFFVQRYVRSALRPHFKRGIPGGRYVEVMRVARVEQLRSHNHLKWNSKGQMWFWLAFGSGIWLNLGRSLRLMKASDFKGCLAARNAGYDTIQLPSGPNSPMVEGYMYEIVDCSGALLVDSGLAWQAACPPPHIELFSGIPNTTLRYAPALVDVPDTDSGTLRPCACDLAQPQLNCGGGAFADEAEMRNNHIRPKLEANARAYLAHAYPQGMFDDKRSTMSFFMSRRWLYSHNGATTDTLCNLFPGPTAVTADMYSPGLFPCTPGGECVVRQFEYTPSWANDLASTPAPSNWIEVDHLSFNSKGKARVPHTWSQFLDQGASGWWFRHSPGSGIFYHAGRTLVAPGKNAALVALLEEWGAADARLGEVRPSLLFQRLVTLGCASFLERLRATANGTATCIEVGMPHCRQDWVLKDHWDFFIIFLARLLQYDTVAFSASLLSGALDPAAHDTGVGVTEELVDVRLPPAVEHALRQSQEVDAASPHLDNPLEFFESQPYHGTLMPFTEEVAEVWVHEVQTGARFTLRDPLHIGDSSRAKPCLFNATGEPTLRLACYGHVSWALRGTPKHMMLGCI